MAATLRGGRPGEDDRFRSTTDDDGGAFVRAMALEAATMLEDKPADRVLAWAANVVPRFVVTSSFGAESAVLLHMVSEVAPQLPVFFLDTGFHFDETLLFRRELAAQLGLTVLDLRPDQSIAQQAAAHGPDLFDTDPDRCCQLRKTIPLRRALASFDGWATGVRRAQTPERAGTPVVESRQHDGRWLVKVAPLATWTDGDVAEYLDHHDLPTHPLVRSTNTRFDAPHSRWNTITPVRLREAGVRVLAETTDGGFHLGTSPDGLRVVYFQGHPEYDTISLLKEYDREVRRYLDGDLEGSPPHPVGYLSDAATRIVNDHMEAAIAARAAGREPPPLPQDEILPHLDNTWVDTARSIFANWLGLVYQTTHVVRGRPLMDDVDPDDPLNLGPAPTGPPDPDQERTSA